MNDEFVPYDLAKELKELGFNRPTMAYYDTEDGKLKPIPMKQEINSFESSDNSLMVAAPLYQQVFKWFREKYNMLITIENGINGYYCYFRHRELGKLPFEEFWINTQDYPIKTYHEAELISIKHLIDTIKINQDTSK